MKSEIETCSERRPAVNEMEVVLKDWYAALKESLTGSTDSTVPFPSVQELSSSLAVAADVQDLSIRLGLTGAQRVRMAALFDAARHENRNRFVALGLPVAAWHDLSSLLQKFMDSNSSNPLLQGNYVTKAGQEWIHNNF